MYEIITVQLGQQSNYLATHFWNAQESYFTYSESQEPLVNHDIHWRPGLGADGTETYMPRTVIYDLKGGFGALRKINALYEVPHEASSPQGLWSGAPVVHREEPIQASAYQQSLDAGRPPPQLTSNTVRYWSDYNRVFFHPRSAVQLNEFELQSSLMPFENWSTGEDLFASLDKEHDLADRDLRPFVEETDQMQAIQLFASFDDAWGGFASHYVERLRDEYGKTPIWVWGLQESCRGVSRVKRLIRLANKARAMTEMYKHASLVVPVSVPPSLPRQVSMEASSAWHTSALTASAIESVLLPARLRDHSNRDTLGNMSDLLNTRGKQNVAGLHMSVSSTRGENDTDVRQAATPNGVAESSEGVRLGLDLSPSDCLEHGHGQQQGPHRPRIFSQLLVQRGGDGHEKDALDAEGAAARNRRRSPQETFLRSYGSSLRFPLLDSFPPIFRNDRGELATGAVDMTASLTTDTSVSDKLTMLRTTVTRSIGLEDRELLTHELADMADEYREGWSSGSDDGDDD